MSTAIITGASKGIGKAIAEELAKRKINVLLIARTESLLQEHASYLSEKYSIKADYLAIDLADKNAALHITSWCTEKKVPVNILINNAGYGLSGDFEQYSLADYQNNLQVNIQVVLELTYLMIPLLKQNAPSYILNVCSAASYQAVPGLTVYAATKAFLLSISRGLHYELKSFNIHVTAIAPGATDTDFPVRARVGEKAKKLADKVNMSPESVAKIAINGLFANKTELIPGFINKLSYWLVWLLPKSLSEKSAAGIYGK